jgi:hypothetical protein
MTTASSYVVEFGAAATAAFAARTDPENPPPGEAFRILWYAVFAAELMNPYGPPLAKSTGAAETITHDADLSGDGAISLPQPAASLIAATATTPLVDADGAIRLPVGASAQPTLALADGVITPTEPLWGSIRLDYRGFAPLVWSHPGRPHEGLYVFILTADELTEPHYLTVQIGSAQAARPAVLARVVPSSPQVQQGFAIEILATADYTLASPYGTPTPKGSAPAETVTETTALSGGAGANTSQPVASLVSATTTTLLVDADGTVVLSRGESARNYLRLAEGALALTEPLWGSVQLVFRGYPIQRWAQSGFAEPGEYVYLARVADDAEPIAITVPVQAIRYAYSWETEPDGEARIVRLFVTPFRMVLLLNSSGGAASFSYEGILLRDETEVVTIIDGAGSLGKAAEAITETLWIGANLGGLALGEDGTTVTVPGSGESLAEVTYRAKYHQWRGTSTLESVLVYLEE